MSFLCANWHDACLSHLEIGAERMKLPDLLEIERRLFHSRLLGMERDLPNDLFPGRTWSFIRSFLRDVVCLSIILAISFLVIWKLIEFIF